MNKMEAVTTTKLGNDAVAEHQLFSSKALLTILIVLAAGAGFIALSFIPFLPSLVSHLLSELGRALSASAVVAIAYEYYLRRSFFGILHIQGQALVKQLVPMVRQLTSLGIVAVHPNRDVIDWRELIRNARTEIKILGTSLGYWANIPDVTGAFQEAKSNSCDIKLLAQDPTSEFAKERGREIGVYDEPEKHFCADIEGSIGFFNKLQCDVLKYSARPPFVIAIIGPRLFCCLLTDGLRGRDSIHLEFERSSEWARRLEGYFTTTWNNALSNRNLT